jgi:hypothetical protein
MEQIAPFTNTSPALSNPSASAATSPAAELTPPIPRTASPAAAYSTQTQSFTPPSDTNRPHFKSNTSYPFTNTYYHAVPPFTAVPSNPLPPNATTHNSNTSATPSVETTIPIGITRSFEENRNVQTNINSILPRPLSGANTSGPVDPFAMFSELPATEVKPKTIYPPHASGTVEHQTSSLLSLQSLSMSYKLTPTHTYHELPTASPSTLTQPQLPPANGYGIHELPSTEHVISRSELAHVANTGTTYPPPQIRSSNPISPWYSASTYNLGGYGVAEMDSRPPANISVPIRPSQTNYAEAPAELPTSSGGHYLQNPQSHANTYPPPIQYSQPQGIMSQQNLPYTNASNLPVNNAYAHSATTELPVQSPETMYTPSPAVSPVSSVTSPGPPSNTSAALSPEATVRRRRRDLMYAITGE